MFKVLIWSAPLEVIHPVCWSEDHFWRWSDGNKAPQTGGDRRQAASGRCPDGSGEVDRRGGEDDRGYGDDLLPLAGGVWRSEERPGEASEGFGTGEHAASASGVGPDLGQADPDGGRPGKLLSPARRRACVDRVKAELRVSERRACAVLRQPRSTQRKPARGRDDELALTADIVELAKAYGRYGYRRITALLRHAGWLRSRLWLNDGSCVRLRAEGPNHVWSYDFVEDRTHDGRKFRMLCVIDEFTREALAIRVKRRLNSTDVLETLADLMIVRGPPTYVRSDNGPESSPSRCEPGSPPLAP